MISPKNIMNIGRGWYRLAMVLTVGWTVVVIALFAFGNDYHRPWFFALPLIGVPAAAAWFLCLGIGWIVAGFRKSPPASPDL